MSAIAFSRVCGEPESQFAHIAMIVSAFSSARMRICSIVFIWLFRATAMTASMNLIDKHWLGKDEIRLRKNGCHSTSNI
jgi:hypothetical protein